MTIGIDARFLGSNTGFDRYLQGLLHALEINDGGHRYIVFVSKKGDRAYAPQNANFKKIVINYPWYGLKEQWLGFRFKRAGVDLMHIPSWNVPWWMPVPFVVTVHDLILWQAPDASATHLPLWIFYLKYRLFKKIFARAVRRSRRVLVPSIHTAKELQAVFPAVSKKIIITGEAVKDFGHLPDNPVVLETNNIALPYLLYVGSAYPHKNLKRLIEAFNLFRVTHQSFTLVLVGNQDQFYENLKTWAMKQRWSFGVRFMDAVDDSVLGVLYRHASLVIYPSLTEGYGLPPLEAWSVGTRAVVSDRGSLPEILGERALYVDPLDIRDIVAKIEVGIALPKPAPDASLSLTETFTRQNIAAYDSALKS